MMRNRHGRNEHHESEQGTVGKGRLHPHRGEHARQRRGAGQGALASPTASRSWTSAAATGRRPFRPPGSAPTCWGSTSRANLVAAGNTRAQELGLRNCSFQQGDATDLSPLEDDRFDLVLSVFGAMFAPKPHDVAKEVVRVTRPGGRIVMGNWIPGDPTLVAQILEDLLGLFAPAPRWVRQPDDLGGRGARGRALRRRRRRGRRGSPLRATPTPSTTPARHQSCSSSSGRTTGRR